MKVNNQESRALKVDGNLLVSLIYNQAGSISKAILEAIMNAIDAKASEVKVYINSDGIHYEVHDNGIGFSSTKEIQKYFEVFGFDHSQDTRERVYGQFGMGRAQLWAFSRTLFISNAYTMDVDIQARGLTYIPGNIDQPIKGTKILGEFYDAKTPLELDECKRELREMVAYTPVPVYLNDELISTVPSNRKWSIEIDEAYIDCKEIGELKVYNQGIFVRSYPRWKFGLGGTIVSKVRLELNMARNDVVVAKCEVWKRVASVMRKQGATKTEKKKSLTDDDRHFLVRRWISGEKVDNIFHQRIIKDVRNRAYTIEGMLRYPAVTHCGQGHSARLAEKVQMSKTAFVVHDKTLEWFDANSISELIQKMVNAVQHPSFRRAWIQERLQEFPIISFEDASRGFCDGHEILSEKELKPRTKLQLKVLRKFNRWFPPMVGKISVKTQARELKVAKSDSALAFTNGNKYIAIDVNHLAILDKGIDGVLQIIHTMIHEYLHEIASDGQHAHDLEFYENYHDVVGNEKLGTLAFRIMREYFGLLEKNGLPVRKATLRDLSEDVGVSFEEKNKGVNSKPVEPEKSVEPCKVMPEASATNVPRQISLFNISQAA